MSAVMSSTAVNAALSSLNSLVQSPAFEAALKQGVAKLSDQVESRMGTANSASVCQACCQATDDDNAGGAGNGTGAGLDGSASDGQSVASNDTLSGNIELLLNALEQLDLGGAEGGQDLSSGESMTPMPGAPGSPMPSYPMPGTPGSPMPYYPSPGTPGSPMPGNPGSPIPGMPPQQQPKGPTSLFDVVGQGVGKCVSICHDVAHGVLGVFGLNKAAEKIDNMIVHPLLWDPIERITGYDIGHQPGVFGDGNPAVFPGQGDLFTPNTPYIAQAPTGNQALLGAGGQALPPGGNQALLAMLQQQMPA